jgi:hypothetical protein
MGKKIPSPKEAFSSLYKKSAREFAAMRNNANEERKARERSWIEARASAKAFKRETEKNKNIVSQARAAAERKKKEEKRVELPQVIMKKRDAAFCLRLEEMGYGINVMGGDGNCLFRAISDQLVGDGGDGHAAIREGAMDMMANNVAYFGRFMGDEESIEDHIIRMTGVYKFE